MDLPITLRIVKPRIRLTTEAVVIPPGYIGLQVVRFSQELALKNNLWIIALGWWTDPK